MDTSNSDTWPIEPIPDSARVFRRVHINFIKHLPEFPLLITVPPSIFSVEKEGISVDWGEYSQIHETLTRNGAESSKNGVVELKAELIRAINPLKLHHDPVQNYDNLENNRAHSLIKGLTKKNKTKIRRKLQKIMI
jgi:hypothetical protein